MPPYDPNAGRDPERDPFRLFGRRLAGLGDWLFTPSERQGIGSTPYLPDVGEGVSPAEVGQKKALGVDMTQPTYPPQAPAAPSTTRPQGGSPETPNTPPYLPDNQFAERPSPFRPDFDAKEWGQKRALDGEGSIRFKEAGGDWQDYDRGTVEKMGRGGYIDSAVGANASPEDWRSRVASPESFSGYQESLDRVAQDAQLAKERMLAKDPFAAEKAASDRQLGLYRGMKDIDRAEMNTRSQAFMQAMQQEEQEYQQAKATLATRFKGKDLEDRITELERAHATEQDRIKAGMGFSDKARNDAFEGIGRG